MKTGLVLLAAVLALSSATTMNRRCWPVSALGKEPFDAEKFSGDWYVVSGSYNHAHARGQATCLKVTYGVTRDANGTATTSLSLAGKVNGVDAGRLGASIGAPIFPGKESLVASVWREAGEELGEAASVQSVEATDYTGFAIFYSCRNVYLKESDAFDVREILNVWSRTPQIDAKLLEVIKVVLAGYGLPKDSFTDVSHEGC